ncbi:MAG: 50S ribosomal protein L18e [Halobacteriales archaeon]
MSHASPRLTELVADLKAVARETGADVWMAVASRLEKPRRTHAEVNLGRIDRYARDGETVVVPGKVLGSGVVRAGYTVAAVDFSSSAAEKIRRADGEAISLEEAIERNPDGTDVRVVR